MTWNLPRCLTFLLLPPAAGVFCFLAARGHSSVPPEKVMVPRAMIPSHQGWASSIKDEAAAVRQLAGNIQAAVTLPELVASWEETRSRFPYDSSLLTRSWLCRRVYQRMIRLDAKSAWEWARTIPDGSGESPAVSFLNEWALLDSAAARAGAVDLPGERTGVFGPDYVIHNALAKGNPAAFLKQPIPELYKPRPDVWDGFRMDALMALIETDLPSTLMILPEPWVRNHFRKKDALVKVADSMISARGPAEALDWAKSLTEWPPEMRGQLIAGILPALAPGKPEPAAAELSAIVSEWTPEAAERIGWEWGRRDPVAAWRWALTLGKPGDFVCNLNMGKALNAIGKAIGPDVHQLMILASLATTGPEPLPDANPGRNYEELCALVVAASASDAQGTIDRLISLTPGPNQACLISICFEGWASRYPLDAMHHILQVPEQYRRTACWGVSRSPVGVPGYWTPGKFRELVDAMNAIPQFAECDVFFALQDQPPAIIQAKPEAAGELFTAMASLKRPEHRTRDHWMKIFTAWGDADPEAAAAALVRLAPDDARAAMDGLLRAWMMIDPTAASDWGKTLPPGRLRDDAAGVLAGILNSYEPELAFYWALQIPPSPEKDRCLHGAYFYRSIKDPEAAAKALDQSGLPEKTRQKIQAP